MEYESPRCLKPALLVLYTASLLLLMSRGTLAVAPGDEDAGCDVPHYPANIRVLLDSWRYQTLLGQNYTTNDTAVWTTYRIQHSLWTAVGGMCENSAVTVCSGGSRTNFLLTQAISKSLPAPDNYAVRIFVNISYSFTRCRPEETTCTHDLELQLVENNSGAGIMPENHIRDADGSEMQFYFDLNTQENNQFQLALVSRPMTACVTVSRVLVYRYECPGHERQSSGLNRRPATQAPISENVSAVPYCAQNSNHTEHSRPDLLLCSSKGVWLNDQTLCECNYGYYRDIDVCKVGNFQPMTLPYHVDEDQGTVQVCFTSESGASIMFRLVTHDSTAIGNFDYVAVNKEVSFEDQQVQCVDIQILNDQLREDQERFLVDVINGNRILSSAYVIIANNSGRSCTEGSVTVVSDANNSSLQLVEMCSSEGGWFSLCDNDWTLQDATVVCRELGFSLGDMMLLDTVEVPSSEMVPECSGDESDLASCLSMPPPALSCDYLLVDCRDNQPTVRDAEESSPGGGGVPVAVIASVGGVAVC